MTFHDALPQPWTSAALVLALGTLAGLLARLLVVRVALPIARRTPTDLDEMVVGAAATPIFLTGVAVGLREAARIVDPERWLTYDRTFLSALLVIWGWTIARLVSHLFLHTARRSPGQSHARGAIILGRFAKVVFGVIIILMVLALWNVSITPLIAGAGIAGIAVAFAAQETLANLFAGVAIFMDRLYEVGDWVVLDQGSSGELRGEVKDVGLRSTRILTRDDVLIIVPNNVIASGRVVNESATRGRYRIRVKVQVAYNSDMARVEEVLADIGKRSPTTLNDPEPRARLRSFDDSGVSWELLAWISEPSARGIVVHDLAKTIHRRFKEEGIEIPFPQRVVHMRGDEE